MLETIAIEFENDHRKSVEVPRGTLLAEVLNVTNSPILFGCRTGICGTCLVEVVEVKSGILPPACAFESESLELYAPENKRARLACQMSACASLRIKKIESL